MKPSQQIEALQRELPENVTLVAVSKTQPTEAIIDAYSAGQRIFGESRPQELRGKYDELPRDIRWHMIGHLQTNKVKYIAPFVELIHSVDSPRLMEAIDKEAAKNGRVIDILLEVRIAQEETKHGWDAAELEGYLASGAHKILKSIRIRGVMGIASLTDDMQQVHGEFCALRDIFTCLREKYFGTDFDTISMGMTHDYRLAVECGSTMVRIGSLIFGER